MQIEKDHFIKKDGKWVRNENYEKSHSCMLPLKSTRNDKHENNQEENSYPPEQLSKKEIGEIRKGILSHPALKLFSDDTRKKILFGDIKPPTEYDKYINENPKANEVEISQIAWLARETAYVGRHLERLVEEKIDNEITEWYKSTGLAFTYRIKPIELSCKRVEAVLILRLPNLREEFKTSYEKFLSVANKCDIDRTKWFNSLPVKPIEDFKKAAENFHNVVYVIHAEALVQLEKHKRPEKAGQRTVGRTRAIKQARPKIAKAKAKPARDQVFICYSRKDQKWLEELQTHLKPYRSVTTWSDKQIAPGAEWFAKIKEALARTKVGVLLVTPDFLASDFIREHELTPLLKETKKGNVCIIWIPVGACSYKETPLKDYQAVANPDKPLAKMKKADRDETWVRICKKIRKAVGH